MVKPLTLKTLDRKAAKLCKLRAGGRCERCGSTQNLEWSHYMRRSKGLLLRWDEKNCDCLCTACHGELGDNHALYFIWRWKNKSQDETIWAEANSWERIPTSKALWMEQENERLDRALKEFK